MENMLRNNEHFRDFKIFRHLFFSIFWYHHRLDYQLPASGNAPALLPEITHFRLKRAGDIEPTIIKHSLTIVNEVIILMTMESYLYGFGPLLSIKQGLNPIVYGSMFLNGTGNVILL